MKTAVGRPPKTRITSNTTMITLPRILALFATLAVTLPPGQAGAGERPLDADLSSKVQVRHSMIGFRDTLLFYTFTGQQAVLRLHISNKDQSLPVTGTIYLFPEGTTDEGLKKWINNQHSDGLFPEIPKPVLTHKLPEGTCKAVSTKLLGEKKNPTSDDVFEDHEVAVSVKAYQLEEQFKLTPFTDKTGVFVKK